MARYYDIAVYPAGTSANAQPAPVASWSSYPNGKNDPGALQVQLDIFASPYATPNPAGSSTITIEGVPIQQVVQAQQYAGLQIIVKGGMQAGLPLADPTQNGLLLAGSIFQSFGNWVGTDMSLEFVVNAARYTYAVPGQFQVNWPQGTTLRAALGQTLATAYKDLGVQWNLGNDYILAHPVNGYYRTLNQLGMLVKSLTAKINPPGVTISIPVGNTIRIYDGSTPTTTRQLKFTDFVGQPTWIDQAVVTFSTVMRADIQVGDSVLMPVEYQNLPGIFGTQAAALPSSLKYKTTFQGAFTVQAVRHIGNFRDPNGASWATIFQASAPAAQMSGTVPSG